MGSLDRTQLPRDARELGPDGAGALGLGVEGGLQVLERQREVEDRCVRRTDGLDGRLLALCRPYPVLGGTQM
jgi:hypothetical protein